MSYKIIGKYINNLNFRIPNPKTFFYLSKDIANYKINIDIKSKQVEEKIIEVQTTMSLIPINSNDDKMNMSIIYSTVVELPENISKKEIEKIVLISVPTEIYPELRKIFMFIFESSGFKEVKVSQKIDFDKLYEGRKI